MSKQDVIEVEGVVTNTFPNTMFEVTLEMGIRSLPPFRASFVRTSFAS